MFQTIADKTEDEPIQLPIICLSRRGGYSLSNPNRRVMSYDGITKDANDKVTELEKEIQKLKDLEHAPDRPHLNVRA